MKKKVSLTLIWPHIVILVLLAAGIVVSLVSLLKIGNQTETLYEGTYVVKDAANTMDAALEGIQKSIYRIITNGTSDITNEETDNIKENTEVIQEMIARIGQNPFADTAVVSELEQYLSELEPMQDNVLSLASGNKNAEAAEVMENSIIPVIESTQKQLAQFVQSLDERETELLDSFRQTQKNTIILLISFGVAGILFSMGVWIHIWRLQRKACRTAAVVFK